MPRIASLMIALPLLGFLVLTAFRARLSRARTAMIGVSSVAGSALLAFLALLHVAGSGPHFEDVGRWFDVGPLKATFTLQLDPLASVMALLVAGVGTLIHLYSVEYMLHEEERDYARFFAHLNLFVAAMLCLVLADDLVLLYLGWEGVGLASFLLIGFWYRTPANAAAATKAFVMTRIGDAAFAVALVLLFIHLGTFSIRALLARAQDAWHPGASTAELATLLLLLGAVGKSAQLPLQTWLPDAMAGPTPVSALIHAATMVTAGVYLIARMLPLFELAPRTLELTGIIGACTAMLGALAALTERDLKRILAYSTMSQLGYMFIALSVAAGSAAIFHLVTHAFFKALLFLSAGAISFALGGTTDLHRMHGIRTTMPRAYWTFTAGAAALAAVPLVTAGFYSKELILSATFLSGHRFLWAAALLTALLTALYAFRVVWLMSFPSDNPSPVRRTPGYLMNATTFALAALSIFGGFAGVLITRYLGEAQGPIRSHAAEIGLGTIASTVSLAGIAAAYLLYRAGRFAPGRALFSPSADALLRSGLGFDALYRDLVAAPFNRIAAATDGRDPADLVPKTIADLARASSRVLRITQNARLRGFAAWMALGAILLAAVVLLS